MFFCFVLPGCPRDFLPGHLPQLPRQEQQNSFVHLHERAARPPHEGTQKCQRCFKIDATWSFMDVFLLISVRLVLAFCKFVFGFSQQAVFGFAGRCGIPDWVLYYFTHFSVNVILGCLYIFILIVVFTFQLLGRISINFDVV